MKLKIKSENYHVAFVDAHIAEGFFKIFIDIMKRALAQAKFVEVTDITLSHDFTSFFIVDGNYYHRCETK